MKKYLIAASVLLSLCMLTSCGGESSVTGTVSIAENTETTTTTAETTTATTASAETTTADTTEAAGADTTDAPAETTTAASSEQGGETTASSAATELSSASSTSSTTQTTAQQGSKSLFDEIRPGMDCTDYVTAHPTKKETAPSCLGEGEDRTYTYSNMTIISYYENGRDIVQEIDLTAAGVKTRAGIEVGMSADQVTAAYGAASGVPYVYHTSDGVLEFYFTDDGKTVTDICLYLE